MKTMKICALVAGFMHSVIVTDSFLKDRVENVKVVFITQCNHKDKLKKIVSSYFSNGNVSFCEWGDEMKNYNYDSNVIFAIFGCDLFISRVNNYIKALNINNVIIDLYDITLLKNDIETIIASHDYFLNTNGIQLKS